MGKLLSQEYYACDQQRKLENISLRNALTGLKNRNSYERRLVDIGQQEVSIGILCQNMDQFTFVKQNVELENAIEEKYHSILAIGNVWEERARYLLIK